MADEKEKLRILLDKTQELGYETEIISDEKCIARISKGNKSRFVVGPLLPLNTTVSAKISRDKNLTKQILSKAGIAVPRGKVFSDWRGVSDSLVREEIMFPLVVKPNDAALGSRVSVNINDSGDLEKAVKWVLGGYPTVLVEEFLPWDDHRLFVVDGKLLASAQRMQPSVIGDGEANLGSLINKLNKAKGEKKVQVDNEAVRFLKMQGYDLGSVVERGKKVVVRGNANIQTGGIIVDVTDNVAPRFRKIAERCARELQMRLAGVDMLCEDISNPKSSYAITELNGLPSYPYIHDHPDIGDSRDPLGQVLEAVFREIF